jgi:sugar/nucleoside kinase (ribokinase family)
MTLGAAGARAVSDLDEAEIEALPVEVVDTICAGDSFMATLISDLLKCGVDEVLLRSGPCCSAPPAHRPSRYRQRGRIPRIARNSRR